MPRIPESSVTRGLPGVSPAPIQQSLDLGSALVGLTDAAVQLSTELSIAEKTDELAGLTAEMNGRLADLNLGIQQNPDVKTQSEALQLYDEGSSEIFSDIGTRSDSGIVKRALSPKIFKAGAAGKIAASKIGYAKQKNASLADHDANRELMLRSFVAATDDLKREELLGDYAEFVNNNPFIPPQDKGRLIRSFADDSVTAQVLSHINHGELAQAQFVLTSTDLLEIETRTSLEKTLEIQEQRLFNRGIALEKRRLERVEGNFLDRIGDSANEDKRPGEDQGFPTEGDIRGAGMDPAATALVLNRRDAEARGEDLNATDVRFYNEIAMRIDEGIVTTEAEINEMTREGIAMRGPLSRESLISQLHKELAPQKQVEAGQWAQFFRGAKAQFDSRTGTAFEPNPFAEEDFLAFRIAAEEMREKAEADKVPFSDLLIRGTKHSLFPLLDSFTRSQDEIDAAIERIEQGLPLVEPDSGVRRRTGESQSDYLKRVGF